MEDQKNVEFPLLKKLPYFRIFRNGVISVFLLLMLAPFFWLSLFAVPSADDYTTSHESIIHGYLNYQWLHYMTWNGRFFSTALQSAPVFLDFQIYRAVPFLLFISFIHSFYFLFGKVPVFRHISRMKRLFFSLAFLVLYLSQITVTSNFYWLSGSVTYILPLILSIYLLAFLHEIFFSVISRKKKLIMIIFAAMFIFLIIGTNETIMMILDAFILLCALVTFFKNRKFKIDRTWMFFGAVALLSSAVVFFAPGNTIRESYVTNGHQFAFSIGSALLAFFSYGGKWLFKNSAWWLISFPVMFFSFRYFSAQKKDASENGYLANPFLAVLSWYFLSVAGFFVPFWSAGNHGPSRTLALIQFVFYLGFIYVMFSAALFIRRHYNLSLGMVRKSAYMRYIFSGAAVLVIFIFSSNLHNAYADISSSRASDFFKENIKIRDMLINGDNGLYIPGKADDPKTISFEGEDNFMYMARYFGKDANVVEDLDLSDFLLAQKYADVPVEYKKISVYFDKNQEAIIFKVSKDKIGQESGKLYIELYSDNGRKGKTKKIKWNYAKSEIGDYSYYIFRWSEKNTEKIYVFQLDESGNKSFEKTIVLN